MSSGCEFVVPPVRQLAEGAVVVDVLAIVSSLLTQLCPSIGAPPFKKLLKAKLHEFYALTERATDDDR